MGKYYDISRLLSKKDLNGKTPELFIVTGNRTAGKLSQRNAQFLKIF